MNKFEKAFIKCLEDGVYPGPSNINERKEPDGKRYNRLNGEQTKQRRELMYAFGIPYQRGNNVPPYEWDGTNYAGISTKNQVPEYPYLTEDDGFKTGIKKPEVGYRKHEFLPANQPWKLRRR